jgi:hypothetical protein
MVSRITNGQLEGLGIEGMGEFEDEFEFESDGEWEDEYEGEEFLGTIARGIGGLLGAGEYEGEWEGEFEDEYEFESDGEWEDEYESEEFFRRIGRFVRRAAPILKRVARVAAPIVGTAVGGPLGSVIGRVAASALREGEWEYEDEGEFEGELDGELEATLAAPISSQQATAEWMADVAARAATSAEAEAMIGAATIASLSPADRAALRQVLPHMVRGTAILTRVLRQNQATRPAVRVVPTIVRSSARTLTRRASTGQPVTRKTAARVMASQTRRVLSRPQTCARAMQRNTVAKRRAARPSPASRQRRPVRG